MANGKAEIRKRRGTGKIYQEVWKYVFIQEGICVIRSKTVTKCCKFTLQAKYVAVLKVLDKMAATAEYGGKKVVNISNSG